MRFLVLTIGFLLACFGVYTPMVFAAPAQLDTSTVATATASTTQRKTFFDTQNQYHWAFYHNGSAIEYSYSADGETWTSAGTLAYSTHSFAAIFRIVDSVSYVFLAAEANSDDVILQRGALGDATVNFDAPITVFDGSGATNRYSKPTVAVSANDKLWVSAIRDFGATNVERFQVHVRRTTNDADGDISVLQAATAVGPATTTIQSAVIMPQTADDMYLVAAMDGSTVRGYAFNGTSWAPANIGGDGSWFGFPTGGLSNHLGSIDITAIAASGNDVYVGGDFTAIGGNTNMARIARWDGSSWHEMGTGLSSTPSAIVIDDTDVYVGGAFVNAGGNAAADYVARWDGTNWNPLKNGPGGVVLAMALSGDDLYVGGSFTNADGNANADRVARWDITDGTWNALGGDADIGNTVRAIGVIGTDVFVGGDFVNADAIAAADYIARWDGAAWNALATGANNAVYAIAVSGTNLYIGGNFGAVSGVASTGGIARWDGASWNAVGSGTGQIRALAMVGGNLYAGGLFNNGGGNANADKIGYWNGTSWNALGTGLNNTVNSLAECGAGVCVGGIFSEPGGVANASKLARWDGSSWNGFATGGFDHGTVLAFTAYQGDVYVGGTFYDVGGLADADHIARWDGTKWNAVTTLQPAFGGGIAIEAFAVIGDDLYIAGAFADMGGVTAADHIARWDGTNIYALGSGFSSSSGRVRALTVDSGGNLYAGGDFPSAVGVANTSRVAYWNGNAWNPMATGLTGNVYAMAAVGTDIYIGGIFTDGAGIAEADRIIKWNGSSYSALGSGLNGQVKAIVAMGTDIYVGGQFTNAEGIADADLIARWDGSAWSAVGTGMTSGGEVRSLAVSGTNLYAGGTFIDAGGNAAADRVALWNGSAWIGLGQTSGNVNAVGVVNGTLYVGATYATANGVNDWRTLLAFEPAIAIDIDDTSEISALTTSSGDVLVAYTNDIDYLMFRAYDSAAETWAAAVTVQAAASTSPNLSLDVASGDLLATWIEGSAITYIGADSPYAAGDWGIQEVLYNTGTNINVSAPQIQDGDDLLVMWTNGAGPYQLYADYTAYGPSSVVISSSEPDPTNSSPFSVSIVFEEDVSGFVIGDITVGNASVSNFVAVNGSTYTVDVTPTADGVVTVDVAAAVAEDAVGNDNLAATQFSILYDRTEPTLVISSSQASPTNNSPFPVSFEFDEDVTGFVIGDISVSNGSVGNFVAVDGNSYTAEITPTAHGAVTVDVAANSAIDAAGNGNEIAITFEMDYDIVDPTVTLSTLSSDPTNDSPILISIEFSENVSGLALGDITVGNGVAGNLSAIDGDSYTVQVTPTTDGVVSVDIASGGASDAAGNDNDAATTLSLTYDNTPPVVTIDDPAAAAIAQANVAAFALSGTCSENGRTVTLSAGSDAGGAVATATPSCAAGVWNHTFDLSALADGIVTFTVGQEDQVGLTATPATRIRTKDVISPLATLSSNEVAPSKTTPFTLSITLSEDATNFALEDVTVTNGVAANLVGLTAASYSVEITPSGQGLVSIDIAAGSYQDLVGNDSSASTTYQLTHDSIGPNIAITSTEVNPTEANVIPVSIFFSEAVSGFSVGDIQVVNATLSNFRAQSAQLYTANLKPLASGAVLVNIDSGVAFDTAANGNDAAPQFAITYENPEGEFKTNCAVWNGFFSGEQRLVWNILEHVNVGTRSFAVETKLYSIAGVELSSLKFSIDPGKQLDLLVHDMPGWASDSYGLVCSTFANEETVGLDGQMVTYKRKSNGGFEYVFASPLTDGFSGRQFVNFNTYQPSLNPQDSDDFIANWIQVANLDPGEQAGKLRFYSQDGELIKEQKLRIRGRGQQDVSAHDWNDPRVGYVEWIPSNSEAKFMLNNTRYLYDNAELENRFKGVLFVKANQGGQSRLYGILDTADGSSILELSNVNNRDIDVTLKVIGGEGEELQAYYTTMHAHETRHFILDAILQGDVGRVSVSTPAVDENSIVATVFQYGRTEEGSVSYLYGVEPLRSLAQRSRSSYNTYVGQDCDLYLSNNSDTQQSVAVSLQRNDGMQVLSANSLLLEPKQTIVSNVCAIESGESYGVVTVEAQQAGVIHASLVRKDRANAFRYPISVR